MQQEDAKVQQDTALVEAEKVNIESSKAIKIKSEAKIELKEVKPAIEAVIYTIDFLSKEMLTKLKKNIKTSSRCGQSN